MKKEIECYKCGDVFVDENYDPKSPNAVRLYCDKCVDEMGGVKR